ncbi:hypothetical protein QBC33DRAFT_530002 [Phialemonium atrogriseum]|uniref:Uncharacterized protein n=1 Tax=Phialemonium atrogriseum TaxID=1093897 RepID=A0AAJ0FJL4_9PEZI|nr:uncharacterized protein QBC33DRAFT_530002 [Phialemonium atrogriseum]KAK1770052.1 hypothetical protein QBC33DRAFT_530002 [Phialemonium atrogriseum]
MVNQPAKLSAPSLGAARLLPAVVVIGSVSAVAAYIRSQLQNESRTMDRFFSQYKSPQSEASRQRVFDGRKEDPRKSLFNVLGW